MASQFKKAQDSSVTGLMSQLVCGLVGVEAGEQNHELALEYCLGNLHHHRFGDVNPAEVEDNYDRLEERMGLHAQMPKQRGLAALRSRLAAQATPGSQLESRTRLLSLLYWLQGLPLQSSFDPAGLAAIDQRAAFVPGTEAANAHDRQALVDELSDYSDEAECCDSGSELSEWDDVQSNASSGSGSPGNALGQDGASVAAGTDAEGQAPAWTLPPALAAGGAEGGLLAPPPSAVHYEAGCLMEALMRGRGAGLPLSMPPATACAAEADLLGEALRLFRAVPGRFLVMPRRADAFSLAHGTHMPDLAPTSLAALLEDFVAAGNRVLRLQRFVSYTTNHAIDNEWGSRPLGVTCAPVTPTMAALFANLALCLEECIATVSPLEEELSAQQGWHGGARQDGPGGLTLLKAHSALQPTFELLTLLESVVTGAVPKSWCSAAECSSTILSRLYDMLERCVQQADSAGEAVLLRLLLGSLEPYMQTLHTWLFTGDIVDSWEEFFVSPDRNVSVTSVQFWDKAFSLRRLRGSQRSLAVPNFMQGVAEGVLAAGKAIHLMTNVESSATHDSALGSTGRQRRALAAAAASRGSHSAHGASALLKRSPLLAAAGGGTLYDAFVASVREMVRTHPGGPHGAAELQRLFQHTGVALPVAPSAPAAPATPPAAKLAQRPPQQATAGTASPLLAPRTPGATEGQDSAAGSAFELPPLPMPYSKATASEVSLPVYTGIQDLYRLGAAQGGGSAAPVPRGAQPGAAAPPDGPRSLEWLALGSRLSMPPPSVILERCLLHPLRQQIDISGMELLGQAMGPWGLMRELRVLRGVFLMASPALEAFAFDVFDRLMAVPGCLSGIPSYELETILKETLPAGSADAPMPQPDSLTVVLQSGRALDKSAAEARESRRPHASELSDLRVVYEVTRPLELILDKSVLEVYNRALVFLLQVRWARYALERTRMQLWKSRAASARKARGNAEPPRPLSPQEYALMQEMVHFVNNLHQFVMDRNLFASWSELEQEMDTAASLDDIIAAHREFLLKVQRQCLLLPDKTWRLLETAILNIITQILQWCHILQELIALGGGRGAGPERELLRQMAALGTSFRNNHRYLMRVLNVKTVKIGGYYGLEHLAMRLNYNTWYSLD